MNLTWRWGEDPAVDYVVLLAFIGTLSLLVVLYFFIRFDPGGP